MPAKVSFGPEAASAATTRSAPPAWATALVAVLAFTWGAAEAVFFFLVPDVLLTAIALYRARAALVATLWALLGALLGGLWLYHYAAQDPSGAALLVEAVPAVSPQLIEGSEAAFLSGGGLALAVGGVSGVPYKIYALHAGALQFPVLDFLAWSAAARGLRFAAASTLGLIIGLALRGRPRLAVRIWAGAWIIGYTLYFQFMPN